MAHFPRHPIYDLRANDLQALARVVVLEKQHHVRAIPARRRRDETIATEERNRRADRLGARVVERDVGGGVDTEPGEVRAEELHYGAGARADLMQLHRL